IVIDALDECVDKMGKIIWNDLLFKLKSFVSNLHLLCTSRDIEDIAGALSGSTPIEIRASDADIKTYIEALIKSQGHLFHFCQRDVNLQDQIVKVITSNADGMLVLYIHTYISFKNRMLTYLQFFSCSTIY